MGIQGLHKGLSFATKKTTLREFHGQTLAVDSSSWLHRSVYSVSQKYVEAMERKYLDPQVVRVSAKYVTSRCQELLDCFQVSQIYLVMDGKRCPLKADTNGERERRRHANLKQARDFMQRGCKDKAEEKYKMCIKIKDELTHAVMDQVRIHFRNDNRVHLVWSPYEADAQLAKLCFDGVANAVITEDSDVLVYSAAAHCAFPVIFKLDRRSGACDVISMDWLLSHQDESSQSNTGQNKAPSSLQALLLNLASRQARRPGFGVRLFVQGCVLAGCDYAPNKLSGVGLVNAFKYVRDNAHRNETIRFAKVLETIPRKNRMNIDIEEYELNLAKSEAVFYYHIVRHQDRSLRPLCQPRISEPENDATQKHTDHFPLLHRFGEDWASFLGESTGYDSRRQDTHVDESPPIKEIVIDTRVRKNKAESATGAKLPAMYATGKKHKGPTNNPYIKLTSIAGRKRRMTEDRPPLGVVDANCGARAKTEAISASNLFAKFARTAERTGKEDAEKAENRAETIKDPRFVKRSFTPAKDPSDGRQSSSKPQRNHQYSQAISTTSFDYEASGALARQQWEKERRPTDPDLSNEALSASSFENNNQAVAVSSDLKYYPALFDLTESNSGQLKATVGSQDEVDESSFIKDRPARVSLESSLGFLSQEYLEDDVHASEDSGRCYDFEIPDPSLSVSGRNGSTSFDLGCAAVRDDIPVSTRSKYFFAGVFKDFSDSFTPQGKGSRVDPDEFIESPNDSDHIMPDIGNFPSTNVESSTRRNSSSQRKAKSNAAFGRAKLGPLVKGFRRQAQLSANETASQSQPWRRKFPPLHTHLPSPSRRNTLDSYFTSKKQQQVPHVFYQLKCNDTQTDEEFLWNTP